MTDDCIERLESIRRALVGIRGLSRVMVAAIEDPNPSSWLTEDIETSVFLSTEIISQAALLDADWLVLNLLLSKKREADHGL